VSYLLSSGRRSRVVRAIVIHHSQSQMHLAGKQSWERAVADISKTHKAKGFGAVGYHGVVDRDGRFHWTRDPLEAGVHAPGRNWDTLAVCFLGDFRTQVPTNKQVEYLRRLANGILPELPGLSVAYFEPDGDWMPMVLGHGDIMGRKWLLRSKCWSEARPGYTECPGNLLDYLKE
jgi:hypothetical protein